MCAVSIIAAYAAGEEHLALVAPALHELQEIDQRLDLLRRWGQRVLRSVRAIFDPGLE
jgi:hypothetical protein